jgi:hypothetical protein
MCRWADVQMKKWLNEILARGLGDFHGAFNVMLEMYCCCQRLYPVYSNFR